MEMHSDIYTGLRARLYALAAIARGLSFVYRKTLSLVSLKEGESLLDVGCGTGTLLIKIFQKFGGGVNLFGIDGSPDMIACAEENALCRDARIKFKIAYADDLPFSAETFAVVTSSLMAHHMPPAEKRKMVGEAWRILKPQGVFIITDLGRPKTLFARAIAFFVRNHSYSRESMNIIEEALGQEGFSLETHLFQFGYIEHIVARKV